MEQILVSIYYVLVSIIFLLILDNWFGLFENRKKVLLISVGELFIFVMGFLPSFSVFLVLTINMVLAVGNTRGRIVERIINAMLVLVWISMMEDLLRITFFFWASKENEIVFQLTEILLIGCFVVLLKKLLKGKKWREYLEGISIKEKLLCLGGMADILFISSVGYNLIQKRQDMALIYSLVLAVMFLLGVAVYLIFFILEKVYRQGVLMKENEIKEYVISEQKSVYRLLMEKNQETRRFRHDIKNHLVILQLLLEKNKEEEAARYLAKITDEYEKITVRQNYYDDEVVDSILTMLCQRAKERNIEVIVEGNLVQKKMNVYDLCCILTNAIGNAVEACEKQGSSGPIRVVAQGDDQMQLFLISNPASEDMYQNILKGISDKEDRENHGLGIRNMRGAVQRMHGDMNYLWDNDEIKLQISVELM